VDERPEGGDARHRDLHERRQLIDRPRRALDVTAADTASENRRMQRFSDAAGDPVERSRGGEYRRETPFSVPVPVGGGG
jgi:hypothetical protein